MKSYLVLFCSTLFFYMSNSLFAQYECPPDSPGCSSWQYDTLTTQTEYPVCDLTVIYKYRNCPGKYEFKVLEKFTTGNCEGMDELWNDPNYLSSFNEWLNILMMETTLEGQSDPPYCTSTSIKVVFYEASCVVKVKCTYTVEANSRVCDSDFIPPYPDYEDEGETKVDIWKLQPCGVTCCKKTYQVCQEATTNGYQTNIILNSREQVGDCTNPDGYSQPCYDGC